MLKISQCVTQKLHSASFLAFAGATWTGSSCEDCSGWRQVLWVTCRNLRGPGQGMELEKSEKYFGRFSSRTDWGFEWNIQFDSYFSGLKSPRSYWFFSRTLPLAWVHTTEVLVVIGIFFAWTLAYYLSTSKVRPKRIITIIAYGFAYGSFLGT